MPVTKRLSRRVAALAVVLILALALLAPVAQAIWQGANFPRNGAWHTISGTYFDTPERVQYQQTGGPCSNMRPSLWNGSTMVWQYGTAVYMCPYGTVKTVYTCGGGHCPDYPGGVYIRLVAGPADGQIVAGWVNGVQV